MTRACNISGTAMLAVYVMCVRGDEKNEILVFSVQHFFWDGIKAHPKSRRERSRLKRCELLLYKII